MAERKTAPKQRKPKSRAWVWWVLAALVVGGTGYGYWLNIQEGGVPPRAIGKLRTICSGNVSYEYGHPKQGYARTLADLGPKDGNYIDSSLASGEVNGYRFDYVAKPGKNGLIEQYHVTARLLPGAGAGEGSLYMDENCEIHVTKEDRPATAADPKLQ